VNNRLHVQKGMRMTSTFGPAEALAYIQKLLTVMHQQGGSDLFISADFPPSMKHQGAMKPMSQQRLTGEVTRALALSLMNERQRAEFEAQMECNFAISLPNVCRFRVNVFVQQQSVSMVVRTIASEIPNFEKLELPEVLKDVVMTKRCLVTHREVGVDTHSWHNALKNTLRQAPDVILIGEIRDTETMEHAIAFAETGHLCLGTLHANNANQTMDRIINFFPEERRNQLLMDLSANLRAIVSQRLVRTEDGKGRKAAIEILLNTPTIGEMILKGNFHSIKEIMHKSRELGMCTFDQALYELYNKGHISYDEAIRNADSANGLRLQIKLSGERREAEDGGGKASSLSMMLEEEPQDPANPAG
jgi:twitching motility protein PilU